MLQTIAKVKGQVTNQLIVLRFTLNSTVTLYLQSQFINVAAPSDPPRPILVLLLMSMVNEKQPFSLRCSVLYCVQENFSSF